MSYPTPGQFAAKHTEEVLRQHVAGAKSRNLAHAGNPAHRQANLADATDAFAASNTAYTIAEIDIAVTKGHAPEWAYNESTESGMDPEAILSAARKSL